MINGSTPSPPMLVFLGGPREFYRDPVYSPNEIYCGPRCETVVDNGVVRSIKIPPGAFDIASLVRQLPAAQKPEIVVVQIDRTAQTLARNLDQLDCIKVLQITDSHHMTGPISFILDYLQSERYDFIISEPCRHHLHYFTEAGFPGVHWLPLINLNVHPQPPDQDLRYGAVFVGSLGAHHPVRQQILAHVQASGIPVGITQLPQAKAAEVFAQAAVTLNVSLNGDLNLRVLEALGAGGFLMTDRVSPQCGLLDLFDDGKELVTYTDEADLVDKLRHYLANPAAGREIRRRGLARFRAEQAPEVKVRQFFDLVLNGREDPAFALTREPRCRRPRGVPAAGLLARLRAYELVQEEHRKARRPLLLATTGVSDLLLTDLADLPRLEILAQCGGEMHARQRQHAHVANGVAGRIVLVGELPRAPGGGRPTLLLLGPGDVGRLLDGTGDDPVDRLGRPEMVLVEEGMLALDGATLGALTSAMIRRGYTPTDPALPAFARSL